MSRCDRAGRTPATQGGEAVMSRGISVQQRQILAAIERKPQTVWGLVRALGEWVNYSRHESVRRAIVSLVRRGFVKQIGGWPKRYATPMEADRHEHRMMLLLMWSTQMGRAEILRQTTRLPTLSEWLSVGNCGCCSSCTTATDALRRNESLAPSHW